MTTNIVIVLDILAAEIHTVKKIQILQNEACCMSQELWAPSTLGATKVSNDSLGSVACPWLLTPLLGISLLQVPTSPSATFGLLPVLPNNLISRLTVIFATSC